MPPRRRSLSADRGSPALSRRQWLPGALVALAVIAAFVLGLWQLHVSARRSLEGALALHLKKVAAEAATIVPADSLVFWLATLETPVGLSLLEGELLPVRQENELARVFVCLPDNTVILDSEAQWNRGDRHPFLELGSTFGAVELARAGFASSSQLDEVEGTYHQAGYAPVEDEIGGVVGFVGVEASPELFDDLRQLRTRLLLVGAVVVALSLFLMGLYLIYARRMVRVQSALHRSETLSAMGRMAAGIAHEIRNPLGIIKNTAQLLKEELTDAGVRAEMVDFIPEEVDRLNDTLTGYLEFARDAPPRLEQIDLRKILRRTLLLMEKDFSEAGIRALDNLDELGQLPVQGDPRRLQQVFLNLFLNALQAMPQGGEIRVRAKSLADKARIEIADTGVGLDPRQAEELFQPFVTDKDKGSGLGLSITRKIVEDHGGSIRMDGTPGSGAVVFLTLPMHRNGA